MLLQTMNIQFYAFIKPQVKIRQFTFLQLLFTSFNGLHIAKNCWKYWKTRSM